MGGGLIQLLSSKSENLFLTNKPEITFFKFVYKRHTNFSIESIKQTFIGSNNFGEESFSIIEKIGDLISKIYLEIDLPEVILSEKNNNNIDSKEIYNKIKYFINEFELYSSLNIKLLRDFINLFQIENININKSLNNLLEINNNKIEQKKNFLIEYITFNKNFDKINNLLEKKEILINQINNIDIRFYLKKIINENNLSKIMSSIDNKYQEIREYILNLKNISENFYKNNFENINYNFSWIDNIGNSLIDNIDIKIGNQIIDKHTGDWLNIFNQLYIPYQQLNNYNNMIGNISELTDYNNEIKKSYKLIIPLQFWFCRFTGLSIPIISLKNQDIIINLKIKNLFEVCYLDDKIKNIDNFQEKFNINIINVKLYINHIFLDSDERKNFIDSTHEYLIEIVQYQNFSDINQGIINLNFNNPIKFISWTIIPEFNKNYYEYQKYLSFEPFEKINLKINDHDKTCPFLNSTYFNSVQPYYYFNKSLKNNTYVYSFSLNPLEYQPSGSINISLIEKFQINYKLNEDFFSYILNKNIKINIKIYALYYNVLKFKKGKTMMMFY